ncbi:MAG: stage V sporulation protein D [Sarcina sp.]
MSKNFNDNITTKKRIIILFVLVCFILGALMTRTSYIMLFKNEEYTQKAVDQWTSDVRISAKRGKILDRDGKELAVSGNVYRVDLDLKAISKYNKEKETTNEELGKKLSEALEMDYEKVLKQLNYRLPSGKPAQGAIVARRISKEQADKVKELNIEGVMVSADTKRYYPNNDFLSQVLGNTNSDGKGLNGIELIYDEVLAGTPGVRITELAKEGEKNDEIISNFTAPVDGKDVVLTINEKLQYFAEKSAEYALEKEQADAVSILIMDPNNGEVLAMANTPGYDPNNPFEGFEDFKGNTEGEQLQKMWRNRAVSDTFEPGSIFKVVTATAALEEGVANNGEKYNCGGSLNIGGRNIKCWKRGGHGEQDFTSIVKNSCNVGFMKLGEALGAEKLTEYIKKFGLGTKSGVDLPGEANGIIKKANKISETDLATISFGQTNTVNMIQFLTAFNSIANGGKLIQPHLMKEIKHTDENGETIIDKEFEPIVKENIASEETLKTLRGILEEVVTSGGGHNTYIEGYRIGGKTGTAQKVKETGGYGGGYVASFVGMAPADNPKVSVFVSIDNPKAGAYYGGQIAAPLAKRVFEDIFNYLGADYFGATDESTADIMIPEVRGMKVSDGKKILTDSGLKVKIDGKNEYIADMNPKPGFSVKEGTEIILYSGESSNYNKDVIVPNLIGLTKDMAESLLEKIGISGKFEGEGIISRQSVEPAGVIKKGETIIFTLTAD